MFKLSSIPLEDLHLRDGLASLDAGAFNCFEGRVRAHNEGKVVDALEYEAYAQLCDDEAQKIFDEVRVKFDVIDMQCFHRIGKLKVGDMAVWVAVIAEHRDAGFRACRYIIDEIKHRLPIWKKEYYRDGDSGWINCEACAVGHGE